ncbi:hypothetical protein GCM10009765_59220 [Fodinicola feengrottensis]|uniref:Uncharacterized protein n=1 Tax=Fodinicola feengrottensis TaxID=435914 RepID=A0ABP4UED6_9ACTN
MIFSAILVVFAGLMTLSLILRLWAAIQARRPLVVTYQVPADVAEHFQAWERELVP